MSSFIQIHSENEKPNINIKVENEKRTVNIQVQGVVRYVPFSGTDSSSQLQINQLKQDLETFKSDAYDDGLSVDGGIIM